MLGVEEVGRDATVSGGDEGIGGPVPILRSRQTRPGGSVPVVQFRPSTSVRRLFFWFRWFGFRSGSVQVSSAPIYAYGKIWNKVTMSVGFRPSCRNSDDGGGSPWLRFVDGMLGHDEKGPRAFESTQSGSVRARYD